MTNIVGIVCDGCGAVKTAPKLSYNSEDQFPPANWYSVALWLDNGVADNVEHHACSIDCLKGVSKHLKKIKLNNKKIIAKDELDGLDAYCIMCKDKRKMKNGVIRVADSGRRMATGICDECGAKVNRILGRA
jgi:Domain of unknown function (DUF5679)